MFAFNPFRVLELLHISLQTKTFTTRSNEDIHCRHDLITMNDHCTPPHKELWLFYYLLKFTKLSLSPTSLWYFFLYFFNIPRVAGLLRAEFSMLNRRLTEEHRRIILFLVGRAKNVFLQRERAARKALSVFLFHCGVCAIEVHEMRLERRQRGFCCAIGTKACSDAFLKPLKVKTTRLYVLI